MKFGNQLVHLSVSDSPDLAVMGLSERHLHNAMEVLARLILSHGLRIGYGGDFREGGFTELLAEEVLARGREAEADAAAPVRIYLSGMKLRTTDPKELATRRKDFAGLIEFVHLDDNGEEVAPGTIPKGDDAARSLTAMRARMTRDGHARIAAGGAVENYGGVVPGVAEEALMMLEAHRPLYVIGAYGGCAGDISASLGLAEHVPGTKREWPGFYRFEELRSRYFENGLDPNQSVRLARTPHIEEASNLILRGLRQRFGIDDSR